MSNVWVDGQGYKETTHGITLYIFDDSIYIFVSVSSTDFDVSYIKNKFSDLSTKCTRIISLSQY